MGVRKYTEEVIKEGKRVRWPKKEQFFPALVTVIVICVFAALVLSLEDFLAGTIINNLKDWFSGLKPAETTETSGDVATAIRMFLLK